jgi:hypothetical protein
MMMMKKYIFITIGIFCFCTIATKLKAQEKSVEGTIQKIETQTQKIEGITRQIEKKTRKIDSATNEIEKRIRGNNRKENSHIDIDDEKSETEKKEISTEISVDKKIDLLVIENVSRNIVVKTWDKPTVKFSTTVYYEGENKLTDDEWFQKLNINAKTTTIDGVSNVRIKSSTVGSSSYSSSQSSSYSTTSGVTVYNGYGEKINTDMNKKRVITITMPKNVKLEIDNKYGEVTIENDVRELRLYLSNCNVDMQDATDLVVRAKYSTINAADITNSEVEMTNGKFTAKKIATLDIDSKYSTVEIDQTETATIRSTNDEYELEEVTTITGRKNYGNLRITKLSQSIEIDGSNADIKIRNISPSVKLIRLDNKYADIRLPMKNVVNYSVEYEGNYSTVYSSFERKKPEEKSKTSEVKTLTYSSPTSTTSSTFGSNTSSSSSSDCGCNSKFTASVGNGSGAKVIMKCENCTVDFK